MGRVIESRQGLGLKLKNLVQVLSQVLNYTKYICNILKMALKM
jgi:hypothetical protein